MTFQGPPTADWLGSLLNAIGNGAGNFFNGLANWDAGNDQGLGGTASRLSPTLMGLAGLGTVPFKVAADARDAVSQTPNPLNSGKPIGGPPNSTLNPAPNGGESGATGTMQTFPNSSLNLSPGGPMGKGSYFNPDKGDTTAGYNSLLLQSGLNPMTNAVGRYASGQEGRMQDQYDLGLASGAITPGMSMEDFQRQFLNSGGVGVSSDLRPILQRGMQLAASGATPGQNNGLSAQDNAALLAYLRVESDPKALGELYVNNLPYALPHSELLSRYIGQAARLNQSRNPAGLTDFVQAYLNGGY